MGEGAFGKVYRAAYVGPNCPHLVAIKMLKGQLIVAILTSFLPLSLAT